MTPGQEYQLYETDRAAWIELAAAKLKERLQAMTDAQINHAWNVASEGLKHAVWAQLTEPQRHHIRSVRAGKAA